MLYLCEMSRVNAVVFGATLFLVSCGGGEEDLGMKIEGLLIRCTWAMESYETRTGSFWTEGQLQAYGDLGPEGLTSYNDVFMYETGVSEMSGVLDGFGWACLFDPQTLKTNWAWEDL